MADSYSSRLLGLTEPEEGPGYEHQDQGDRDTEGEGGAGRLSHYKAPAGFENEGHGVDGGYRRDPTGKQILGDEDRGEEEDQEDGGPYDGTGLLGAKEHRDPGPEHGRRYVHEHGEP